jgi:protein-tyrosine phosphatase
MQNLVDLHSHILPGLDDGADNLSESLQMLEALEGFGYGFVFATPHHQLYSWDGIKAEIVETRVNEVAAAASEKGIGVKILPGMEYDLDETLPERATAVPGGAGHILVDVGFFGVPLNLADLIRKVETSGTRVILVHPERNRDLCLSRSTLSGLVRSGVRLLGNIGSFSGMYGRKVKRDARELLQSGYYWAIASDMHSIDQVPWIKDGIDDLIMLAGRTAAEEMMATRPMQIVQAMEVDR